MVLQFGFASDCCLCLMCFDVFVLWIALVGVYICYVCFCCCGLSVWVVLVGFRLRWVGCYMVCLLADALVV